DAERRSCKERCSWQGSQGSSLIRLASGGFERDERADGQFTQSQLRWAGALRPPLTLDGTTWRRPLKICSGEQMLSGKRKLETRSEALCVLDLERKSRNGLPIKKDRYRYRLGNS